MDDLRLEIGDGLADALRRSADEHGRSVEEEALALIRGALQAAPASATYPPPEPGVSVGELFRRMREEVGGGVDFEPPSRADWKDRPLDLLG